MWHSNQKKLEEIIHAMPSGEVFAIADFIDMAQPKTVSKILTRIQENGVIESVMRGIYWKPSGIALYPAPDLVARALARENAWRLVPCGDTALHLFGLDDKKPTIWTYVTDGTYRSYSYRGVTIQFLHSTGKLFSAMSQKTALLVQVLKAYGKEHITDEIMTTLAAFFNSEEARTVIAETRNVTDWIAKVILEMFKKKAEESV